MQGIRIVPIDLSDVAQLIAWNDVLRTGYNQGREAAWWRSPEATVAQFQLPKPGRTSAGVWALDGERPVGAAEAHVDPGDPADVEVAVVPERRREGIGRALAAAVTLALTDVAEVVRAETYCPEGVAFGQALGLTVRNQESRQLLDLPVSRERLGALGRVDAGVQVSSWSGPCPEEVVEDWAGLVTQMKGEVPLGDLSRSPSVSEVAHIRQNEQRMQAAGYVLVRSLARVDGRSVGYTEMFVSIHASPVVAQDDTFVDRGYRRRGVASALKVANLCLLQELPEAQVARWVQTYSAVSNEPMLALNRAFGFREVDTMTALEGPTR